MLNIESFVRFYSSKVSTKEKLYKFEYYPDKKFNWFKQFVDE